jgi:YesN/AraC family two-component response regulator
METYEKKIPAMQNKLELCYFSEGSLVCKQSGTSYVHEKWNVSCNLYEAETHVCAKSFHRHHSVSFYLPFEYCEKNDENAIPLPRIVKLKTRGNIHNVIDEIIHLHTVQPNAVLELAGLALQAIGAYAKLGKSETARDASLHAHKAQEYVYEHLQEPISQKEIAEYLGISPEYLCAVFKQAVGEKPIHFINTAKLNKILSVMEREGFSLQEASFLFGYNDANYVSRLFRLYYGKTASELLADRRN